MIARDKRRALTSEIIRSFGPLPIASLAVWGLFVWREHGIPKDLRILVDAVYWALVLVLLALLVQFMWEIGWYIYHLAWLGFRETDLKLDTIKTKRKLRIQLESVAELRETTIARKDELIEEHGQQWWDERREELDRLADEIEAAAAEVGNPRKPPPPQSPD